MTGTSPTTTDLFAALLRSEAVPWSALGMVPDEFPRACSERDVTGLICERLRRQREDFDWPQEICDALARETRLRTARELLRQQELISVLDVLSAEDIDPILLKGTALAYSLYDSPASRPRIDTDLL